MISNCLLIQTGTLEAHLTGDWCVSICGLYGLTISTLENLLMEGWYFDFKYRRGKELYLSFKLEGVLRGRGNLSAPCSANHAPQDAEPGT